MLWQNSSLIFLFLLKQKSFSSIMKKLICHFQFSPSSCLWVDQYFLFFSDCRFLCLIILITEWWNVCLNTWLDCWKQYSWWHGSFLKMWMWTVELVTETRNDLFLLILCRGFLLLISSVESRENFSFFSFLRWKQREKFLKKLFYSEKRKNCVILFVISFSFSRNPLFYYFEIILLL